MKATKYSNSALNPLTLAGTSKHDLAYKMWYSELTPSQRLEIMAKVGDYKQMARKLRACLNYIAENLV